MKPIRIFRHIDCEGPAYFQTILEQKAIPFELIRIDEQEPVNSDLDTTSGLLFMGGNMSVNDPLDWIAEEIKLIQSAVERNIPVMGICLGSQLIAKALGAKVYPGQHNCMELGWGAVQTHSVTGWSDDMNDEITVFHWHGETFDLPEGASRIFSNNLYENQGFVVGPHLALQFHLEMTEESIKEWLDNYPDDVARRCDAEHDKQDIIRQNPEHISAMQQQASLLFNRWLSYCAE